MKATDNKLPDHSPLGASGAYQWMACPGSPQMSKGIVEDDSEYASEGSAAHVLAEHCEVHSDEAWMFIGRFIKGSDIVEESELYEDEEVPKISKEMVDAVQYWLDQLDEWHPDRDEDNSFVEYRFHCPTIHPLFYGTADFVIVLIKDRVLHIWDYKHGAGVVVEVDNNPQIKYYAGGVIEGLDLWDEIDTVAMHIVQPRGWHSDGPHRHTEISIEELEAWLFDELVPAMNKAETSTETHFGSHCRFCPARAHQCPSIMAMLEELEELLTMAYDTYKDGAPPLTDEQVGRIKDLEEIAKIVFKANNTEALKRLNAGKKVPGAKLVNARKNKEFKKGAERQIKKQFGTRAYIPAKLKSPAQIEKMAGGAELVARWAFKPQGGVTVAADGDPRQRINRDAKSLFSKKGK